MSIAAIAVVFSLSLFIKLVRLRIYRPTTLKPKDLGDASRDNQSLTFLFRHLTTPVVLSTCSVNSLLSTLLMIFLHVLSTVPCHSSLHYSLSLSLSLSPLPWRPGLKRRRECKRTPAGGQEKLIPAFESFLSLLKGTGGPSRFRSSKDRGAGLKENPDSGQTHMAGEITLLETSA